MVFPIVDHTLKHYIQPPETWGKGQGASVSDLHLHETRGFDPGVSSLFTTCTASNSNAQPEQTLCPTSHFKIQREEDFVCR